LCSGRNFEVGPPSRRATRYFLNMTGAERVIDVRNLTKSYGKTQVLRGIDLQVERGTMLALLGPNGAGKTTTVRISDLLRNTISTVVMLLVGLVIGFRSAASFSDWLAIAGIILLFTFAFSWLSAIVGLTARSVEAVQWLTFVMVFPLTFASTTFVPSEGMHPILKVFAVNQPITQVVEAVRALMLGEPIGNYGWLSVGWSVGILLVAVPLASWLFRRRTSS
jgi:energy-coupling factor transporter ATP-binding protein EcfA2